MKKNTAKRFLSRNAWKIARRNIERKFGWIRANSFDQRVIQAKKTLGITRTIPELLRQKF